MQSRLPKVLHQVAGQPMVAHVIAAAREAGSQEVILVVGHGAAEVRASLGEQGLSYVLQERQLGTGHAVLAARHLVSQHQEDTLLVLCGDTPLLRGSTLAALVADHANQGSSATILTFQAVGERARGYGRVLRDQGGQVTRIVEERDATPEELAAGELNSGCYCFQVRELLEALASLDRRNAQGEYYLTDVIAVLRGKGRPVTAFCLEDAEDALGVNDREQLARAEAILRHRLRQGWLAAGVTMIQPETVFIDAGVVIGRDTVIQPFTFIQGDTQIGEGCLLGPQITIKDSLLGAGSEVSYSVVLASRLGSRCQVGPFAYLRPGTSLADGVKVGDFVEIKNSSIGEGSKVPHLSYVGDATVGRGVNIGAGTITCNYDGQKKWPTVIGDGAFIGSNTNLVAPVAVGDGAFIGAGSTITKDVPAEALAVERAPQRHLAGYHRRQDQSAAGKGSSRDGS